MDEFKNYHPIVNFVYFVLVIAFSCTLMHPVSLCISFFCAFLYSVMLGGKKALKTNILFSVIMLLAAALLNPAFNHEGMTVLTYLPSGNPLTLESIVYGLCAGLMIAGVICWFSCYNKIMTSDKFIYLFAKIIPSLSLVLSMTLRFIPKLSIQLKKTINAQKCIGRDISQGSLIKRLKCGLSIISILITWALESSIETADSMKSRGFGLSGRTAFSIFKLDRRDFFALLAMLVLGAYVAYSGFAGLMSFSYFPSLRAVSFSISAFSAYFMLLILPVVIELKEAYRWKSLKSKT